MSHMNEERREKQFDLAWLGKTDASPDLNCPRPDTVVITEAMKVQACGVDVVNAVVPADGGPVRYRIRFKEGEPSYKARMRLEKENFDVGSKMMEHEIYFYASRRSIEGRGWTD